MRDTRVVSRSVMPSGRKETLVRMTTGKKSTTKKNAVVQGFRENYLLFQLAFVSHKFSEEFHKYLRSQEMSPSKWRVLVNIMEQPGIRVTRLARNTLFEQSRVTKLTDQLCSDGLVVKAAGVSDRRRVHLTLTKKGERILVPLIEQARLHEEKLLAQLDAGDRARLKDLLNKLVEPHLTEINK